MSSSSSSRHFSTRIFSSVTRIRRHLLHKTLRIQFAFPIFFTLSEIFLSSLTVRNVLLLTFLQSSKFLLCPVWIVI
jgi:hypothetical protein